LKRDAITGIGVISPVGSTVRDFWSALVEGRSGIGPLKIDERARLNTRIAAQVHDFDPELHFPDRSLSLLDRFAQFAVVAARDAVRDAGVEFGEELALQAATVVGTGAGAQITTDDCYFRLYRENSTKVHPFTIPRYMANAAASQISIDLGLKGPTYTVATACASGTHAIGQAFHLVRSGSVPIAVAGGTEACLTVGTVLAWEALRVLSADTCRPFSRNRSGLVLGEGAAMLILEEWDRAAARGARIYAELRGFGMSADARDAIVPDCGGAERAMQATLRDAGADPEEVDYVNAHGTGTVVNDANETKALRGVFGGYAGRLAVSSSKAVLGHGLGCAGAMEAAAIALATHEKVIPPTANFEEPDPECDLDVVPNIARRKRIRAAMSNSFAFGGLNAVLLVGAV
jgi:nodulation protein E